MSEEKDEEKNKGLLDPESGLRTTLAIGTEVGLNTILDLFSMDPTQISQVLGAQAINYLAQRIRGGEFSEGEMIASGLASLIPGAAQAKSVAGGIARTATRGAVSGALETGAADLIDTGEIDSERVAQGAVIGGAFGGIFGTAASQPATKRFVKRFQNRLNGERYAKFTPEEIRAMGLEQPMMTKTGGLDDDALNKRYKEINNPDSYITDQADPDFGKLRSEVEPVRAAEAAADKKIYDAEKLELDKKFIMEHPLGLDNLVPDETILDLKKESRQVAALMWDINYPFEDKKGFRFFDQEIRKAMEKQFPGQDLKLRSHHLNPLKSGAAMLNGLSMEDRAEATARLLDEFGLVGGNSPFQNTVLPREIHNEVHRFLSRFSTRYLSEIGDPQLDNSFYRLSLEGRMPMLKRYAQMIRQSEELIFSLMQAQNIASGAVDTMVTPETATEILSRIPTNTTETTFKFLRDAYDGIKKDLLKELGEDTIGIGGGTNINIAPEGADLKTIRKFEKMQANPQKYVASDDEYRSMALDRIFKFRRIRQLDIFETKESLRAEIAKIAKRLKQEDLDPRRGRFRK